VRVLVVVVLLIAGSLATPATSRAGASTPGCVNGPAAGTPQPEATPGITRVDYTYAHRVDGRCRTLVTQVRAPTGNPTALPLLLVLHGANGDPNQLAPLLDVWAEAGYVVAAPALPKVASGVEGTALAAEVARQAADARYLLDSLLDRAADLQVDAAEVGVAGMSRGGMAVYGLISQTCCRDGRIGAAIVMAGVHDDFPDGKYVHQKMPVFLIQGDADVGYHHSRDAYPQLAPPKWFVTLHGERHSPPFEAPRGKVAGIVDGTTTAFWNRYLKGDTRGASQLVGIVASSEGKATLQRDLSSK
jgi:poly(3-hydroxybutyrate) depolymerase